MPKGSTFCQSCGTQINTTNNTKSSSNSFDNREQNTSPKRNLIKIFFAIWIGVGILSFIIAITTDRLEYKKLKENVGHIEITEIMYENIINGRAHSLAQKYESFDNSLRYIINEKELQTIRVRVKYKSLLKHGQRRETFKVDFTAHPDIYVTKSVVITPQDGEFYIDLDNLPIGIFKCRIWNVNSRLCISNPAIHGNVILKVER